MVDKEFNLQTGVYKVQTFGTTQNRETTEKNIYSKLGNKRNHPDRTGNEEKNDRFWELPS